jgi:hypothetical protein
MYLLFMARYYNGFEAGKIHYEGHWKGWALEIETFWALKRVPFGPKNVSPPPPPRPPHTPPEVRKIPPRPPRQYSSSLQNNFEINSSIQST